MIPICGSKRIFRDMVSNALNGPRLVPALEELHKDLAEQGGLEVEMVLFGLEQRIERSVGMAVYNFAQELVANALQLRRPTEISIAITRRSDGLSIIVSDKGGGSDPADQGGGTGLDHVRSRVVALGGVLHIDSTPGHGTTISIELPLPEGSDEP